MTKAYWYLALALSNFCILKSWLPSSLRAEALLSLISKWEVTPTDMVNLMLLIITEVFDTNTQINTRFMTGGPEWPALCWAVPPHGCIGPNRRLRGLCSLRSDRKILLSSLSGWMFLISSIRTVRFHPSRCRLFYGTRTMGMRLLLVARSAMSLCQGARLDFCSFISGTLLNFRELVCL